MSNSFCARTSIVGRVQRRCLALSHTQQRHGDLRPFPVKRVSGWCLAGATIPVLRVRVVTFFAMQIRVNPCTCGAFVLLSRLMRSRPVAFGIPPLGPRIFGVALVSEGKNGCGTVRLAGTNSQSKRKASLPLMQGDQLENVTTCFELDRGTS